MTTQNPYLPPEWELICSGCERSMVIPSRPDGDVAAAFGRYGWGVGDALVWCPLCRDDATPDPGADVDAGEEDIVMGAWG